MLQDLAMFRVEFEEIEIRISPFIPTNFRVFNFSTRYILNLCESCCQISTRSDASLWKSKSEILPLFSTDFLNFDEWTGKTSNHVDEQVRGGGQRCRHERRG